MPPAASVGPSCPSVPPLRMSIESREDGGRHSAACSAISWFRPPRPVPLTTHVVSPPPSKQIRCCSCELRSVWSLAANSFANARASISTADPHGITVYPRASASQRAACSAMALVPTNCVVCTRGGRVWNATCSPVGVSGTRPATPAAMCCTTRAGSVAAVRPRRLRMHLQSWNDVGSGTVGPEAMTSRGSPTTSLSTSVIALAGYTAAASCPPCTADRCLRIVLSSLMEAPWRAHAIVVSRTSCSVNPSAGSGSRADPPPETRMMTISSCAVRCAPSMMRRAALCADASGMLFSAPWMISTRHVSGGTRCGSLLRSVCTIPSGTLATP
eukprot:m.42395 g.42395  ORF g.42395 m.42395 type:complete len:329 (-) comp15027_c0_seq2:727-1713(-)